MNAVPRPYTLVAELTYRCPLQCLYCSNPIALACHMRELDTATWLRVLAEAEALGVLQVTLTGGEPLARSDLELVVAGARRLDLYTTLVTSGVPLSRDRAQALRDEGLDAVQLSIQDVDADAAGRTAGVRCDRRKLAAARWVRDAGLPLTLNVVLHRGNLPRVGDFVALAFELGAHRLELANVQYLGWALRNRAALLPDRDALAIARAEAAAARERFRGRMEVVFVTPDYWSDAPKPCMDGWGRRFIVVAPDGLALPCQAAHTIPGLELDDVRTRSLAEIWRDGAAFTAFRGESWMPEPCRSCPRRTIDFGGCRCQAYHLTGNAAATDPACALAPAHDRILAARAIAEHGAAVPSLHYRTATERIARGRASGRSAGRDAVAVRTGDAPV